MGMQSAAATLSRGHVDLNAVLREHIDSGAVQMGKSNVVDAAGQKSDFATALTHRGKCLADLAEEKLLVDLRREPVQICHAEEFQQAGLACHGLHTGTLIKAHQPGHKTQSAECHDDFLVKQV